LETLSELEDQVYRPWNGKNSGEEVVRLLEVLEQAPEDAAFVLNLRPYLARRALLEGQNELAAQLSPNVPKNGASMLRDMKAMAAEAAHTPPRTQELSLGLPLPEPEPLSLRPAMKESLHAGLPEWTDLSAAETAELRAAEIQARKGVLQALDVRTQWHLSCAAIAMHHVHSASNVRSAVYSPDPDTASDEEEVEKQLGRPLLPEERLLARRLLSDKRPTAIAAVLREMARKN